MSNPLLPPPQEENAPDALQDSLRLDDIDSESEEEQQEEAEDDFYLAPKACTHCRRRRVRCCRTVPVCANCERRKEDCNLWLYETEEHRVAREERVEEEVDQLAEEGPTDGVAPAENDDILVQSDHPFPPSTSTSSPAHNLAHLLSSPTRNPTLPAHPAHSTPSPNLAHLLRSPAAPYAFPPPPPVGLSPVYETGESGEVTPEPPSASRQQQEQQQAREVDLVGLRETREALCRAILFGAEAPLEDVKLDGVDVQSLYNELLACDRLYPSSPSLLSPFSPSPPLSSLTPLTLAPGQARACLAAYFRLVEPSLGLYASRESQVRFQEMCLEMWNTPLHGVNGNGGTNGHSAPADGGGTARPRGWWSMYLATVAFGMMALSEGEAVQVGLPVAEEERANWAREVAEEGVRSLGREGFATVPTLEGLRASLLLLTYELGGLSSMPDIPSTLSSLSLIVGAAFELGLNCEAVGGEMGEDEKEERRGLWWKVFELESAWSPLLARRLSLIPPSSFSTRLSLNPSSTSQYTSGPSLFQSALIFTNKLSHLLNSPNTLTPLDLVPLVDQFEHLSPASNGGQGGTGEDLIAELLKKAAGLRLRALRDEVGEKATEEEEKRWEELAYDLLTTPPSLILQVDRFQQLLAVSTFLHAVVLVALRLHIFPFLPCRALLISRLFSLITVLKTASWTLHLHQTVHRGVLVLEHLVSPSSSSTLGGFSASNGFA